MKFHLSIDFGKLDNFARIDGRARIDRDLPHRNAEHLRSSLGTLVLGPCIVSRKQHWNSIVVL